MPPPLSKSPMVMVLAPLSDATSSSYEHVRIIYSIPLRNQCATGGLDCLSRRPDRLTRAGPDGRNTLLPQN
jgi:hypothetical protein